jgi:hypothetical protein
MSAKLRKFLFGRFFLWVFLSLISISAAALLLTLNYSNKPAHAQAVDGPGRSPANFISAVDVIYHGYDCANNSFGNESYCFSLDSDMQRISQAFNGIQLASGFMYNPVWKDRFEKTIEAAGRYNLYVIINAPWAPQTTAEGWARAESELREIGKIAAKNPNVVAIRVGHEVGDTGTSDEWMEYFRRSRAIFRETAPDELLLIDVIPYEMAYLSCQPAPSNPEVVRLEATNMAAVDKYVNSGYIDGVTLSLAGNYNVCLDDAVARWGSKVKIWFRAGSSYCDKNDPNQAGQYPCGLPPTWPLSQDWAKHYAEKSAYARSQGASGATDYAYRHGEFMNVPPGDPNYGIPQFDFRILDWYKSSPNSLTGTVGESVIWRELVRVYNSMNLAKFAAPTPTPAPTTSPQPAPSVAPQPNLLQLLYSGHFHSTGASDSRPLQAYHISAAYTGDAGFTDITLPFSCAEAYSTNVITMPYANVPYDKNLNSKGIALSTNIVRLSVADSAGNLAPHKYLSAEVLCKKPAGSATADVSYNGHLHAGVPFDASKALKVYHLTASFTGSQGFVDVQLPFSCTDAYSANVLATPYSPAIFSTSHRAFGHAIAPNTVRLYVVNEAGQGVASQYVSGEVFCKVNEANPGKVLYQGHSHAGNPYDNTTPLQTYHATGLYTSDRGYYDLTLPFNCKDTFSTNVVVNPYSPVPYSNAYHGFGFALSPNVVRLFVLDKLGNDGMKHQYLSANIFCKKA